MKTSANSSKTQNKKPNEIKIQAWVGEGLLKNTYALDPEHPMHPYNQAKSQGAVPEDFGIENPYNVLFEGWTRSELIDEVMTLRNELNSLYKAEASGSISFSPRKVRP